MQDSWVWKGAAAGGAWAWSNLIQPLAVNFSAGPLDRIRGALNGIVVGLRAVTVEAVIIFVAAATLVAPKLERFRQRMSEAGLDFVTAIFYLQAGYRRTAIQGAIHDLLNHVASGEMNSSRTIYFMGYSFGSLLAIDALFPPGRQPDDRFSRVDTLITIACPFDFVRSYWPNYFADREWLEGVPRRWVNVYSSIDVLSSNFRNDSEQAGDAEKGVTMTGVVSNPVCPTTGDNLRWNGNRRLNLINVALLVGLQAHNQYWDRDQETSHTVFDTIVQHIFPNGDPRVAQQN